MDDFPIISAFPGCFSILLPFSRAGFRLRRKRTASGRWAGGGLRLSKNWRSHFFEKAAARCAHFVGANFALFGAPCDGGRPHVAPLPLLSPPQPLRWVAAGTPYADNSHTCGPRSVFPDVHAAGKNRFHSFRTCGCELCEALSTSRDRLRPVGRRRSFSLPCHAAAVSLPLWAARDCSCSACTSSKAESMGFTCFPCRLRSR